MEEIKNKKPDDGVAIALGGKVANLIRELSEIKTKENLKIKEAPKVRNNDISQFTLNLENSQNAESYQPLKTADNYIAAGSFARAVLLSGVDATTSLNASSDPDPV